MLSFIRDLSRFSLHMPYLGSCFINIVDRISLCALELCYLRKTVSLSTTYDHQFIPYLGSHVIFRCAHLSYARAVFHSQSISVLPASTSSSVFSCVHSSYVRIYLGSRFVNIIERILSCTTLVHSSICDLFHLFVRAIVITIITCHHFCSGL